MDNVPDEGDEGDEGGGGVDRGHREDGTASTVVGFSFMAKKMESMAEVMAVGPVDGVEFYPLDFSRRPDEHRHLHAILHKLSEDIMFRDVQPEGDARLSWIETYLTRNPQTVILDPINRVSSCINRVTTLQLLEEAYRKHGAAGGMPCPPRFMVLKSHEHSDPGTTGAVPRNGLAFPVICKPIEACGTRGSHSMVVVLDEAGMVALSPPVVVQEFRNHGGKLFKVCVVGDEVRVHERPSLPDLPRGLTGSFGFDSQKPYPTLEEVVAASAAATVKPVRLQEQPPLSSRTTGAPPPSPEPRGQRRANGAPGQDGVFSPPPLSPATQGTGDRAQESQQTSPCTVAVPAAAPTTTALQATPGTWSKPCPASGTTAAATPTVAPAPAPAFAAVPQQVTSGSPLVALEAARLAAARMKETFGLSLFGFDLIIDRATGEIFCIDVNYFPSFKDLPDFPQVLRRRLNEVVARRRAENGHS